MRSIFRLFLHSLSTVTVVSFSAFAAAQTLQEVDSGKSVEAIERVVTTGSRIANSTSNSGYVVSSVSSDDITFVSPSHIQEVLNFIAGAGVQRGNGQEYLPALRSPVLTGAGACGGILAAEDNIPLRAAGFCNINELFEAHGEMAERIEVLKGPASPLYGSNAIHGVINVITPDVTKDTALYGIDYGSYGYSRLKLRQGKDFGDSGVGINASITRDSGYRDEESVDQEKVNLRHRYEVDNLKVTSGLTYTHLDQETAGYITGFESYKDEDIAQGNDNPEAFRKAKSLRVWSKVDVALSSANALSVTPYFRDQSMEFRMHFLPGTPLEENEQEGFGVLSQYHHVVNNTLSIDAGLDAEYTRGSLVQSQDSETVGSAFLVETVPVGLHYDYQVDATLYAPFIALNWQQAAWAVSLGGRYEYMDYDYTNNIISGRTRDDGTECGFGGCRYARPESDTNDYSNFSPKLSVSFQSSDTTLWYAGLSRGYRAPQATELYRLQRSQQIADLDSVTATNIEMGVKGQRNAFSYVVSVYSLTKDNVIYRDSDFFNVSNGETWHRGVELTLNYQIGQGFDFAFAGSYAKHTYEHSELLGEVDIKGNDIDTAPNLTFNARLGYSFTQSTRAELEWQHIDDYYTDAENLHEYEGHDLLNLRASWEISPEFSVYARVNNLFDTAYAERADYTTFTADRYFPGRPRNVMFSVDYQY
ncbi:ligand-gated channel protein [Alteromonas stellipolaris]|uniref:TonB-dependent receptor n=1 Tax=Alteromonas stellipolaris TaxID=233316 RepID=UPI00076FECE0|nr:TonB-dependent receptor [Alteromonas stellipolaris]AMJ96149.1 ligand-gated channel protein [Alteromonas stellipolaris]